MLEYLHFDSIVDPILSRERILKYFFINTFMFRAKKSNGEKSLYFSFLVSIFFFFSLSREMKFSIVFLLCNIPIGKRETAFRIK